MNLCDTCKGSVFNPDLSDTTGFPNCIADNVLFGDGKGNDNIYQCSNYEKRMTIQDQLKKVAEARQEAAKAKEKYNARLNEWKAQHELIICAVEATKSDLEQAEEELRRMGLEHYAETGEKKPCEGVGIRVTEKLNYNRDEAFEWAVGHKMALGLDTKAFEKIAKASPMSFVTIETVPTATIATDLSKYLEGKE